MNACCAEDVLLRLGPPAPGVFMQVWWHQDLNHSESQHDIYGLPYKMNTFLTLRDLDTLSRDERKFFRCFCDVLVRVFMQGNLVFNAQQELIYRRDLERPVVEAAIDFAAEHGTLSMLCFIPARTHASASAQPFPQMST